MTDERKDEAPAASADEWPKRAPPTIDLDASEVSGDARTRRGMHAVTRFLSRVMTLLAAAFAWAGAHLAAPVAGAVAALAVVAVLWFGGLIAPPQPAVSPTQSDNVATNVGDLTARLTRLESAATRPAAAVTDPALVARAEAHDRSIAALRDDLAKVNAQLRTLVSSLNELKAVSRDGAPPAAPDLGQLNERLSQLEQSIKTLDGELARARAPQTDDVAVRRLVLATTLETVVRRGEPFAAALAAAKQAAADPAVLAPLDPFAASGVPSETASLREIVTILQRLATAGSGRRPEAPAAEQPAGTVMERLQSGLGKLVRIERTDAPADTKSAPAAKGEITVRRDSIAAARQDVAKLPQANDPQIQAWMKSVDARDAALTAAQKFSAEALAALSKSGQ